MPAVPTDERPPFAPAVLEELIAAYALLGPVSVAPFGEGRIHRSYRLLAQGEPWLLQQLNEHVFSDIRALGRNVHAVTSHLAGRSRSLLEDGRPRPHLTLRVAANGDPHHRTADGRWWRVYHFIEGAPSSRLTDLAHVRQAARCFGEFLHLCADIPPAALTVTIPHFHDTPRRYRALRDAVAADAHGRVKGCREAITFAQARAPLASRLQALCGANEVPERIVHNDCKLDNVLFDPRTGEALCVVDLDTVMPGFAWHDIGDLIRSAAATGGERSDTLTVDLQRFEAVIQGYLVGAGGLLSTTEVAHLVDAGQLITYELALRFLADHLGGDRYFRVAAAGDNLRRAQRQFSLLASMEREARTLERIVERVAGKVIS